MPDLVLPRKRSPFKVLARSVLEIPLFWYLRVPVLICKSRLTAVLILPIWLLFPPLCLFLSFRGNPFFLPPLGLAALAVVVHRARRPKFRIAEVKDKPIVKADDVTTSEALRVIDLDANRFLTTAHHFPRLANLLRRLEVEVPLKVSGGAVQVFRDKRVWEIAFREAVETGADYLQLEHLFFGVLAGEEMKETAENLDLKIEEVHETIKWIFGRVPNFGQGLENLKFEATRLEKEREVVISYPALVTAVRTAAEFFPEQVLSDKALNLLDEAVSRVVKVGGNFVGSQDVSRLKKFNGSNR